MNSFVRLGVLAALAGVIQPAKLSAQTVVQINFTGGIFTDSGGTPLMDGRLLQLVASTSGASFSRPTPTSFVGGSADDRVIATFAVDSITFGEPGTAAITLNVDASNFPGLSQNDPLLLRWFDLASGATSPGIGASYGEFRSDTSVDGGDPWFFPSPEGSIALVFATAAFGGSQSNLAGRADLTAVAIPEPSATIWLTGFAALGLAGLSRRLKRPPVRSERGLVAG